MKKILKAIEAMVESEDRITDLHALQETFFFKYGKYLWSIQKELGEYYLIYYVKQNDVKAVMDAIKFLPNDPGPYITYNSKDYREYIHPEKGDYLDHYIT
ncbi:hypothetical protein [Methanococcoides sp. FTZ1]|uniref:hypothetical protein n=1 Tax=Methanococcoides sp. FTZ1 TaxID=3439061 RepID=UPI003F85A8DD